MFTFISATLLRFAYSVVLLPLLFLMLTGRAPAAPLSDEARQQDPRLEKRVTFVSDRISIRDLLEKLSALSGVAMTAGERDGAGDDEVSVALHDVKVGDAMNALWSLVSYQKAEWNWTATGEGKSASYHLARPPAAQALAARLQAQVQQDFEAQAKGKMDVLKMTPEQRKQWIADLDRKDPEAAKWLKDDGFWAGFSIFAGGFSPEMQTAILRGEQKPKIAMSQLSDTARAYIHSIWERGHFESIKADGTHVPFPAPSDKDVVYLNTTRDAGEPTPSLYIEMGEMGGGAYVGGMSLERAWRKKTANLWLLPGDATEDAAEKRLVVQPKILKPDDVPVSHRGTLEERLRASMSQKPDPRVPKYKMAHRLAQMADAAPLSLMARLPQEQTETGLPYGKPVLAFLETVAETGSHVQRKWRGGVLLLTYPAWFQDGADETRVPLFVVKRLREREAAAPDGFLSVKDLAYAAGQLTPAQLEHLADRMPVAAGVAHWHKLFALMGRSPALLARVRSPQGALLTPELLAAVVPPLRLAPELSSTGTVLRVRMMEKTRPEQTPPARELIFSIVSATGEELAGAGFGYQSRQFDTGKGK